MRTAKGLADMCTASPEPSLLDNTIQNVSDVLHGTAELDFGLFVLYRMDIKHILYKHGLRQYFTLPWDYRSSQHVTSNSVFFNILYKFKLSKKLGLR